MPPLQSIYSECVFPHLTSHHPCEAGNNVTHRKMEALEGNQLPRAMELWALKPGVRTPSPGCSSHRAATWALTETKAPGSRQDCLGRKSLGSWTPCDCPAAGAGAHSGHPGPFGSRHPLTTHPPPVPAYKAYILINALTFPPPPDHHLASGHSCSGRSNSHHPLHLSLPLATAPR